MRPIQSFIHLATQSSHGIAAIEPFLDIIVVVVVVVVDSGLVRKVRVSVVDQVWSEELERVGLVVGVSVPIRGPDIQYLESLSSRITENIIKQHHQIFI